LAAGVLGRHLVCPQRREQQGDAEQRDIEGQGHRGGQVAALQREHARVHVVLGQTHRDEIERHKRGGDEREHARVASLTFRILDGEAQRLVGGKEEHDDQERDERRLAPDPPVPPGRLGPDRAGDQCADPEDERHVNGNVGAHIPAPIARAQVPDRHHAAEDEPAQRHDGQRYVDVEDLLHEALVGVERGIEEHQRERGGDRDNCGE
jgi:hypothetical protein